MITTKVYYKNLTTEEVIVIYQDTGAATRRLLDNTLNDGRFELSKSRRQMPYPRFHGIRFTFDDGNQIIFEDYMILGDIVNLESKGSEKRWTHTITLIEPTKLHERMFIGSKRFSRNKDGTAIYTMYDALLILKNVARTMRTDLIGTKGELFTIPNEVKTILERIEAPQLVFDKPTLREAINGLLSFIDATYELDIENTMILRFFNERTGEITDITRFDDETRITIGDYYSTEMDMVIQNAVSDKPTLEVDINQHTMSLFANYQNSQNPSTQIRNLIGTIGDSIASPDIVNLPITANYGDGYTCITDSFTDPTTGLALNSGDQVVYNLGFWGILDSTSGIKSSVGSYFRTEDVILGDTNMIIKLNNNLKLYEIEDVYIGVREIADNVFHTARCTEFFVTQAEYAKLPDERRKTYLYEPSRQSVGIYDIGGNKVTNLGKQWGVFGVDRTIENMIFSITLRSPSNEDGNLGGSYDAFDNSFGYIANDQILFTFIFRPIVSKMRVTVARDDITDINIQSSIRENQNENILSAQNYGNNLSAKANRFGNEQLIHTETVVTLDKLKDRGNIISGTDYILTEVEKVIWPEFIKAKYTFTKLFNRYSEFIGLEARRRQYELSVEQSVDRLLNYTEYLQVLPGEFDFTNDTSFSDFALQRVIESLIYNYGDNKIRGVLLTSNDFAIDASELYQYEIGDEVGIYLPIMPVAMGKSLNFTFAMQDSISAGDRLQEDDDTLVQRAVSYKNGDGFLGNMRVKLLNYINPAWGVIPVYQFVEIRRYNSDVDETSYSTCSIETDLGNTQIECFYNGPLDTWECYEYECKRTQQDVDPDFDKYVATAKNEPAVILDHIDRGSNIIEYTNAEYRLELDVGENLAAFTQQLQLLGYQNQVGVGNKWAEFSQLILGTPGPTLYLYTSDYQYARGENRRIKTGSTKIGNISDYASIIDTKLVLNASGISAVNGVESWAIGTNNSDLLVYVNQGTRYGSTTILSFKGLNERDGIVTNITRTFFITVERTYTSVLDINISDDYSIQPFRNVERTYASTLELSVSDEYKVDKNGELNAETTIQISVSDSYSVQKARNVSNSEASTIQINISDVYEVDKNASLDADALLQLSITDNYTVEKFRNVENAEASTLEISVSDSYTAEKIKEIENSEASTLQLNVSDSYDTDRPVEWVAGGTSATVDQTCDNEDDIDNVKVEYSCAFVEDGDPYTSAVDKTTSQPACSDTAQYIVCFPDGEGAYVCQNYIGDEEAIANYFTCTLES